MQGLLYNSVVLRGWTSTYREPVSGFLCTAMRRPDLAAQIRYLSIGLDYLCRSTCGSKWEADKSYELVTAVIRCPNLQRLHVGDLTSWKVCGKLEGADLGCQLLERLIAPAYINFGIEAILDHPSLRHVTVQTLAQTTAAHTASFIKPPSSHLTSLDVVDWDWDGSEIGTGSLLEALAPSLEALHLPAADTLPRLSSPSLVASFFALTPNLRRLDLPSGPDTVRHSSWLAAALPSLPLLESLRTNSVYISHTALVLLLPPTIRFIQYCNLGWARINGFKKARKGASRALSIERQLAEVLRWLESPAGAGVLVSLVRLKLAMIHGEVRMETGEAREGVVELRALLQARSGARLELVKARVWEKKPLLEE